MITRDLFKRTPVRLAVSFATLFALTVIVLFLVLFVQVSAALQQRVREQVEDARNSLVAIDASEGFDALSKVVANEAATVRDDNSIFMLLDNENKHIAGQVRHVDIFSGWRVIRRADLPEIAARGDPSDGFVATWNPVSKGMLLVAITDRHAHDTRTLLLNGLGLGLAASTAIALALGFEVARRTQAKIDVVSRTLSAVADGDIRRRVPVTQTGDDLDHVAHQLNTTLDRLEGLIDGVKQVTSDIAHDLKTPLGRVRRRLETILLADDVSRENIRLQIETAVTDIDSIVDTFEAMLRITEIEAGARRARFERIDARALLIDIADVYQAVAEDCGMTLTGPGSPPSPALDIRGDRELLTQLFANLIENAIRHGGPTVRISLAIAQSGEFVVASVSDNGPGIPEHERERVFRRFYRLEKSRSTPGSGLGLALVKAIANMHGAGVNIVDNAPGLRIELRFLHA